MRAAVQTQDGAGLLEDKGIRIEFESFPDIGWVFDNLPSGTSGIELLNIQHRDQKTFATVFVPDGKLQDLVKKVEAYQSRRTDRNGKPRDSRDLINTIENITLASLRALWTDADEAFPAEADEPFWWEAWLSVRGNRDRAVREFMDMAAVSGMSTSSTYVKFPERTVVLARADLRRMRDALPVLTTVAELRRAKDTAAFFTGLVPHEERRWVDDLVARTTFAGASDAAPRVCVVDTGINRGHPLLAGAIDTADMSTIRPDWGIADTAGHGTGIAGLSLYGDLTEPLASSEPVRLEHRLESSKLLAEAGGNSGDEHLHADLTR